MCVPGSAVPTSDVMSASLLPSIHATTRTSTGVHSIFRTGDCQSVSTLLFLFFFFSVFCSLWCKLSFRATWIIMMQSRIHCIIENYALRITHTKSSDRFGFGRSGDDRRSFELFSPISGREPDAKLLDLLGRQQPKTKNRGARVLARGPDWMTLCLCAFCSPPYIGLVLTWRKHE
jgi:hypothetical protein